MTSLSAEAPVLKKPHKPKAVPEYLVYEVLEGIPLYYAWVFTAPRKIMVAQNKGPWLTVNWNDDIKVMEHTLNLQSLADQLK